MYLGRYQQGQEVPFVLLTKGSTGVPVAPDAAPLADVYSSTGLLASGLKVPALDGAAVTGLFQGFLYLDESYPVGHYSIEAHWVSGVFTGSMLLYFEVAPGGDATGQVLALCYYHRPQADFLVQQRTSGRVFKGKNPRVA